VKEGDIIKIVTL